MKRGRVTREQGPVQASSVLPHPSHPPCTTLLRQEAPLRCSFFVHPALLYPAATITPSPTLAMTLRWRTAPSCVTCLSCLATPGWAAAAAAWRASAACLRSSNLMHGGPCTVLMTTSMLYTRLGKNCWHARI